jgi:hypothetical protein
VFGRNFLKPGGSALRHQLVVRVALALAAATVCVTAAGVLAARQEASQRIKDRAATARSVFHGEDVIASWAAPNT